MCGIVGYIGEQEATSILLAGFRELEYRGYASFEAMNGLRYKAKNAAQGFRDPENFIEVTYLRISKPENIPNNPLSLAIAREYRSYRPEC